MAIPGLRKCPAMGHEQEQGEPSTFPRAMHPFAAPVTATPPTDPSMCRSRKGAAAVVKVALAPYSDAPPLTTASPPLFRRLEASPYEGSPLETSGELPGSPDTHRPVTANPIAASPPSLANQPDLRPASASSVQAYTTGRDLHSPYTEEEKGPVAMGASSAASAEARAHVDATSKVQAPVGNRAESPITARDLEEFRASFTKAAKSYDPENPNNSRMAMLFARLKAEGKI